MFRQLKLASTLALKDGRLFLADRRGFALAFVVPIILASAFGMIFDRPGQREGKLQLPLLVVIEEENPLARSLVNDLKASEQVVLREVDRATAERELASHQASVALVLPAKLGETRPAIELLYHPQAALEVRWAEGVFTEVFMKRAARTWLAPLGLTATERPFEVHRHGIASGGEFNTYSHSFSGMTLQYLLFWGMECGLLLLRERQRGIWLRLAAAPVPLTTALLGRTLSTTAIALLQFVVTFGFGWLVFGVRVTGSPIGFVLLALAVSLLAAGVGLFVAAVGRTEACARNLCIVVILAAAMIGGLWLPAFLLPEWLREGSRLLPTTWAMRGFDGATWQGQSLLQLAPSLALVFSFSLMVLLAAIVRLHGLESRRRRGVLA